MKSQFTKNVTLLLALAVLLTGCNLNISSPKEEKTSDDAPLGVTSEETGITEPIPTT